MPAKKENRMRKEFEEKDIHQEVRLNKYLSEAGVCSRREADRLIEEGKVFVDGVRAENGRKVTDEMEITVNGKRCSRGQKMVLLAFHKPEGVVCTTDRRWNDVTVEDVLQYPTRVFSVGRLDKDSEGLLLVTNNGDIINQIMRAGNYHEKEYLVTVDKPVTEEFVEQMSRGGIRFWMQNPDRARWKDRKIPLPYHSDAGTEPTDPPYVRVLWLSCEKTGAGEGYEH